MNAHIHRGLTLLAQRAVWAETTRTLFVADVHLGKAATFRALGQPIPAGTTRENLDRLSALVDSFGAAHLIFLGDLFHARVGLTASLWREFELWRERHARLEIKLVIGNHDLRVGAYPSALRIEAAAEPLCLDGVECRHVPLDADELASGDTTVLAGHWHPATRLHGPGRDSLRFPCFHLRGRQIVLPAFGEFTGGAHVDADQTAALCVIAGERLTTIPARAGRERTLTRSQYGDQARKRGY